MNAVNKLLYSQFPSTLDHLRAQSFFEINELAISMKKTKNDAIIDINPTIRIFKFYNFIPMIYIERGQQYEIRWRKCLYNQWWRCVLFINLFVRTGTGKQNHIIFYWGGNNFIPGTRQVYRNKTELRFTMNLIFFQVRHVWRKKSHYGYCINKMGRNGRQDF